MGNSFVEMDIDDGGGKIVLLQNNARCYAEGIFTVVILYGGVECFGHVFQESPDNHLIFSHISTGIYLLECIPIGETISGIEKENRIKKYIKNSPYKLDDYTAAILLQNDELISLKLYSQICKKFRGLNKNYPILIHKLSMDQNKDDRISKGYLYLEGWNEIVDVLLEKKINSDKLVSFISCGQKSSGKSTLNRYVTNKLLSLNYNVYWLDCDIGQSEFTPSGCISLIKVTSPLFGPSFSHINLNSTDKSLIVSCYIGENSPNNCLSRYIQAIEYIYVYFMSNVIENTSQTNNALILNSQGWIENVGQDLLVDIIRITKPNLIVQLSHIGSQSKLDITNELIHSNVGYHTRACITGAQHMYTIGKLVTETGTSGENSLELHQNFRRFKPNESRLCSFMEYFFNRHDKHCVYLLPYITNLYQSISFYKVVKFKWREIFLSFSIETACHETLFENLPLKIVGLCTLGNMRKIKHTILRGYPISCNKPYHQRNSYNTQIRVIPYCQQMDCIGLGIIRNIDLFNECFYLLTPLHPHRLSCVNVIVVGNSCMPHELNPQAEKLEQYPSYHGPIIKRRQNMPRST